MADGVQCAENQKAYPKNPKNVGYAFNKTRQAFVATRVRLANTYWTRLVGLIATPRSEFDSGQALWIVPCHGVHTWGMRFPIDVIYLDAENKVVHIEEGLRPWRFAAVRMDCATVLELPSHTVYTSGTCVGDTLELNLEDGKRVVA